MHPDFEKNNIKLGKEFIQLHGSENFDAMAELLHEDL